MSIASIIRNRVPSWLSSGEGGLVLDSIAAELDDFILRMRESLKASMPSYGPSDALPYIGRDRKVLRGIGETDDSYRVALIPWLDRARKNGTPWEMCRRVRAYCQAAVVVRTVDNSGNWFWIDADGTEHELLEQSNWDWDGNLDWGRFWIIIYPADLWESEGNWGDAGTWGDGGTIGTTALPEHVATIRAIASESKPEGTRCEGIIIALDPASFAPDGAGAGYPDGTWGEGTRVTAGNRESSRLETARYWEMSDNG
jgi:hypothetical protein